MNIHSLVKMLFLCFLVLLLASCSGGGGGDDGDIDDDAGGGPGTGDDNIPIFWYQWVYPESEPGVGAANAVLVSSDGGFILTGYVADGFRTVDNPYPEDLYLAKTDDLGIREWETTFGGTDAEIGNCIAATSDGGYIMGGIREGAGYQEYYLLRIDSDGNALAGWPKVLAGASFSGVTGICESRGAGGVPDGFVLVGPSGTNTFSIIKIDLTGSEVWKKELSGYDPPGNDYALSIVPDPSSGYVIAGVDGGPTDLVCVLRIDSEGNLLPGWPKTYGHGTAFSVENTPDGGLILAGKNSNLWVDGDMLIIKIDASGNETWRKTFGGDDLDEASSVAVTADGGYMVVGRTHSFNSPNDPENLYLVRLSGSGDVVWEKVKGRTDSYDSAESVKQTSDGGFIVCGGAGGGVLLTKTDKNGDTVSLGTTDWSVTLSETFGTINPTNVNLVAERGVSAVLLAQQVGAFGLDLLLEIIDDPGFNYCTQSGSLAIVPAPGPVSAGDTFSITLTECVSGEPDDPVELDGTFGMEVDSLTGSFSLNSDYTITATYSDIVITSLDDADLETITGGMSVTRQASGSSFTDIATNSADTLSVTLNAVTSTLTEFEITSTFTSSSYSYGAAGEILLYQIQGISGDLTLRVIEPVTGSTSQVPASGHLSIEAEDGSTLEIRIDDGDVDLDLDSDGDGIPENTISSTWDALY
ncbi:MAG: hypothetical protein ACP5G0_12355 [Desulfomonilia bacterium]